MNYDDVTLLDTTTIDQIKAFSHDNSMIVELFNSFTDDASSLISNIRNTTKDYPGSMDVKGDVHSLKGVAGTIGASRLHEICKTIDAKLKNEDIDGLAPLYDLMSNCYDELEDHIKANYL